MPVNIHHRAHGRTACGRPDDRRDPETSSWAPVTCRACLAAGLVEIVVDRWKIYAPEATAERVQLVLEAVAALVKSGREPRTIRWIMRSLLTQNLERGYPTTRGYEGSGSADSEPEPPMP